MQVGDMELEDVDVARFMGALRAGLGVAMFVAPRKVVRSWTGEEGESLPSTMALRGMAVRDIALGLGLAKAADSGGRTRGWLEAAALSDAGDAVATLFSWRELGGVRRIFWFAVEAGAAVLQMQLAEALDED
ncbi:MAG TPA: hypothetical protein VIG64_02185 [Actinomycetota bacterium]|jgi:hypothetical protein